MTVVKIFAETIGNNSKQKANNPQIAGK